jgi:hypothetical protein
LLSLSSPSSLILDRGVLIVHGETQLNGAHHRLNELIEIALDRRNNEAQGRRGKARKQEIVRKTETNAPLCLFSYHLLFHEGEEKGACRGEGSDLHSRLCVLERGKQHLRRRRRKRFSEETLCLSSLLLTF